ncbi:hypothetical protein [Neorickettsia sennetsu]|uniref:Uncharacterized protein n=1 Tax=Ehrlichia sennetsu (strain ATCC VR-367 / Miyayama) TaxID=222891 RepID=Q2GEX3_EHRS3|nr:hypothetical protein [Neorickettsia sennetsu]ABD45998.1 hypothetical protein NSE_0072 [Neorickettsia sennetsu str. Miyayama]
MSFIRALRSRHWQDRTLLAACVAGIVMVVGGLALGIAEAVIDNQRGDTIMALRWCMLALIALFTIPYVFHMCSVMGVEGRGDSPRDEEVDGQRCIVHGPSCKLASSEAEGAAGGICRD